MVRPQKKVSTGDEDYLIRYLAKALSDPGKTDLIRGGDRLTAQTELNSLQGTGSTDLLQNWINKWLTEKGKNRMWSALRQQRYKERHKLRMVAWMKMPIPSLSGLQNFIR